MSDPTPKPARAPLPKKAPDPQTEDHTGSKYLRRITGVDGTTVTVDVYAVIDAYAVTCPAVCHAIKKLLAAGLRGKGERRQDLTEAIDALTRAVQMEDHRVRERARRRHT